MTKRKAKVRRKAPQKARRTKRVLPSARAIDQIKAVLMRFGYVGHGAWTWLYEPSLPNEPNSMSVQDAAFETLRSKGWGVIDAHGTLGREDANVTVLFGGNGAYIEVYEKPYRIMEIRDNKGKTADRYTFITDQKGYDCDNCYESLSTSDDPGWPQGVSRWGEAQAGWSGLGKKINWNDVPPKVRVHVVGRMRG